MFNKNKNNLKEIPDADYKKLLDDIMNDPALADFEDSENKKSKNKKEVQEDEESTAVTKWSISELNDLTDEFSSEKLSDDSIDEKLLLALGYLSQNEEDDILDRTVRIKEQVFGLRKEFSDEREIPLIKARFAKEKKTLFLRLVATCIVAFLIFCYPFIAPLLSGSYPFFNTSLFFMANMFVVLQMLLIAAAFSARDLAKGLLKAVILRPNVYSPPALLITMLTAFEIFFAFTANSVSGVTVSMYCFPAALSLVLPIISDIMRMNVQEKTFDRINANTTDTTDVFHLSETKDGILLEKNGKDIDFYKRTRMQHTDPKVMNFVLIPGVVFSMVAGLYIYFVSKDVASAISLASVCVCVVLPSATIMNYLPFFLASTSVLDEVNASVVGRSSVSILSECDCITVNEKDMFESQKGNSMTMDMYEIDKFFDVFYYGACALKNQNSALANLFLASAETLELSDNVKLKHSDNNGISVMVDGNALVRLGNRRYVESFGIAVPDGEDSNEKNDRRKPSFVLYIVKNDILLARSDIYYTPSKDFAKIASILEDSGTNLRIISSDFVVSDELIKEAFSLNKESFEIVKVKNSAEESNKRSSLAVSLNTPAPLFSINDVCHSIENAENAVHTCSIFTSVISAAASILLTVFSFVSLSPYLVILFNAIMLLPSFLMAKICTSHFTKKT